MMNCLRICFAAALLVLAGKTNAQSALNTALNNPVILSHYSQQELQSLAAGDSAKLNAILYYYTQSYTVEVIPCTDCVPFDPATFDISRYEHLRLQDSVYTREFTKYGFRLTLFPINALPYVYPVHSAPKVNPVENEKH